MRSIVALAVVVVPAIAAVAQQAPSWEPYSAALQARATAGDVAAQFQLGEAYRTGNGIAPDREQAIAWYRKASTAEPRAADALGILLFTKGERRQAIPLLQAGAVRGNDYALYILGTARFNGDYVPKDIARGYADLRIAAATLEQARHNLAKMEPYVTPEDRQRADLLAAQPGGPEAGAPSAPAYAPRPAPPVVAPRWAPSSVSAGPVAPPAPATAEAIAPPLPASPGGSSTWTIQLGAYGSEERAAAQWSLLAARVPALAKLRRVTEAAGALVRLQATGIASRDDAAALCRAVTEAGSGCFVVGQGTSGR